MDQAKGRTLWRAAYLGGVLALVLAACGEEPAVEEQGAIEAPGEESTMLTGDDLGEATRDAGQQ